MDEVLNDVDWVVKGIVGDSNSYLSDDKYEVYTDYAILQPVILYPESASRLATPGPAEAMKVTLLGGTVSVGPLRYTFTHQALPSLDRGQTGLFLLDEVNGKLFVAAKYYGVFDLSRQKLLPMVRKPGFGEPYVGQPASEAISSVVQRLAVLRKKNAQLPSRRRPLLKAFVVRIGTSRYSPCRR
jgi:hypothetical protein